MGLGRPADPEHIGDTFLVMKRSEKGPNSFSQAIKDLEPGRMYSLKMFSCDYQDLVQPRKKTQEQAQPFVGRIAIDGVELDAMPGKCFGLPVRPPSSPFPTGPTPPNPPAPSASNRPSTSWSWSRITIDVPAVTIVTIM
jgi:hypothetical protein